MSSESQEWGGYKNYDHYYWVNPTDIVTWFNEAVDAGIPILDGKQPYYNIPASFDIETSSWTEFDGHHLNKRTTMYLWSFCLNGSTILGRTWAEWLKVVHFIEYHMSTKRVKLIIYVHNLGYEFQFMRGWFKWEDVFAVKDRRPVHATLENSGIEFKCSYLLSNYALSYIGAKLLRKYPVEKAVGDLDYSKVRHSGTGLTQEEVWYSVKDVQVVCSYIQEKLETEGPINEIPLTNTGYVRRYCREYCFTQFAEDRKMQKKLSARYHEQMKHLGISSQGEYDQLHHAFAGGFTHAAPLHSGKLMKDVGSADEASAYPGVMVMKKFPMSRGTFIGNRTIEEVERLILAGYCVLFTIRLENVTPKFIYENYISLSRCVEVSKDVVVNNGRVSSAKHLQITVTEQDWDIIKKCYDYDKVECYQVRYYYADYLPRPFILSILKLFGNKTSLKGVEGKETEYMVSKNMINSAYGMSVTNIIRDIYEYSNTDGWVNEDADVSTQLISYNNNHNRFLFYAWGVWVTAHARHNLWEAIFEFGEDFIYADTDSIKGLNFDKHKAFFSFYNNSIKCQISKVCKILNINPDLYSPKTKKGVPKTIGVWEIEESYKNFKTIGAKRYIYEYQSGELLFTVSGVNKHYGVPYLLMEYAGVDPSLKDTVELAYSANPNIQEESKAALKEIIDLHNKGEITYDKIFDVFEESLYFPETATGKQTLTYIDEPITCLCTDYVGSTQRVFEFSGIHMEPQSYYMSQTEEYKRFLEGFRDASL